MVEIIEDSHTDHGLTKAHLSYIRKRFQNRTSFFKETIILPYSLEDLPCGIYGPIVHDDPITDDKVIMRRRGDRKGESRIYKGKKSRQTRLMTVIAGPYKDYPMVLYTAFGGPCAPKEPFDCEDGPELDESLNFWSRHALSDEG